MQSLSRIRILAGVVSLFDRVSPQACYVVAAIFAVTVLVSCSVTSSRASQPPAELVAAVRLDLAQVGSKVDTLDAVVTKQNELLLAQHDILAELKTDIASLKEKDKGGRRNKATEPITPACLKAPGGVDTDISKLTAAGHGEYVLDTGEKYSAALVRHGFLPDEVAKLDEPTCQRIYDGWRTLHPPVTLRSVSVSPTGQWQCSGGKCWRR